MRLYKITSLDVITGTKVALETNGGFLDLFTKREAMRVLSRLKHKSTIWNYIYDMEYVPPVKGE